MDFIDSFKVHLSEFHLAKLRQIDEFDYSVVTDKVNKDMGGLTPAYLSQGVENLKRYYAIALLDPRNRHAVSKALDPFWHTHILFTSQYRDFCRGVFGHFIHHAPLDDSDKKMVAHVEGLYVHTQEVYDEVFHEVDHDWWPRNAEAGYQLICFHYLVSNEEILKNALFEAKPDLMASVSPLPDEIPGQAR